MSQRLDHLIIQRARDIIADPDRWTTDALARKADWTRCCPRDADAVKFCAVGAIQRATWEMTGSARIPDSVAGRVEWSLGALMRINDSGRHGNGHAGVLRAFDSFLAQQGE